MWQTFDSIWLHFIWSTKNREPLIDRAIERIVYEKLREIAKNEKIHLDHINGIEDHVHCLVSVGTTFRIFDVPKLLKGSSSHFVNEQKLLSVPFEWQDGYGVFFVSPSQLARVRQYIANQKLHHQKISFVDEMSILKKISQTFQ